MKILLFGKNGQVGRELQRSLAPLGDVVALASDSRDLCGDLADLDGIASVVRAVAPDFIVNAAAYTAVDKAESERGRAELINAKAPGVLAREAQTCGAWLVHYSTDYVFSGEGDRPWRENDPTAPVNAYGASKRGGEIAIQSAGGKHLIFRTSWVYAAHGRNFIKTMLRLGGESDRLGVVDDQIGAPTGAEMIADVTASIIQGGPQRDAGGIYHLVAAGETSWYAYARFIFDEARRCGVDLKLPPDGLAAVKTSDFPTPAKRPHNSRLDNSLLKATFGLSMPDWREGVARVLTDILGQKSDG